MTQKIIVAEPQISKNNNPVSNISKLIIEVMERLSSNSALYLWHSVNTITHHNKHTDMSISDGLVVTKTAVWGAKRISHWSVLFHNSAFTPLSSEVTVCVSRRCTDDSDSVSMCVCHTLTTCWCPAHGHYGLLPEQVVLLVLHYYAHRMWKGHRALPGGTAARPCAGHRLAVSPWSIKYICFSEFWWNYIYIHFITTKPITYNFIWISALSDFFTILASKYD